MASMSNPGRPTEPEPKLDPANPLTNPRAAHRISPHDTLPRLPNEPPIAEPPGPPTPDHPEIEPTHPLGPVEPVS